MDTMPETVKCPHCGENVEKFYYIGELRAPKHIDPSCNKMVKVSEIARAEGMSEDEVREKFTAHISKQEGKRMVAEMKREGVRKKVGEREGLEEEEEEEEEEGLFKKPRTPHKVLEDILRDFECRSRFINRMIKRSRRQRGIHPSELQFYISKMHSGIKSDSEARFIAEEYQAALTQEDEKAREMDRSMRFPIGLERRTYRERPREYMPPRRRREYMYQRGLGYPEEEYYEEPPRPRSTRYPRKEREGLSREDVAETVTKLLEEREERSREDRLADTLSNINRRLDRFEEEVKKPAEGTVTRGELENIQLTQREEMQREMLERQGEQIDKISDELSKERGSRDKEMRDVMEESYKRGQRSATGEYTSDSARLTSEGLNRLADVIERKEPMKVVVRGLEEKPPERKMEKGAEESIHVPREYVKE